MATKNGSKKLVELAKRYTAEENKRALISAQLKQQEETAKVLKAELMEALAKDGNNSVGFDVVRYWIEEEKEPQIENIDQLYTHIQETGEFELLYRRLNPKSVKERWDAGKNVPGVAAFPVTKLHSTGVKAYAASQQAQSD